MSHRILRLLATVAVAVLVACASPPGGGTLLFAVTDSASSGGSGVTVNVDASPLSGDRREVFLQQAGSQKIATKVLEKLMLLGVGNQHLPDALNITVDHFRLRSGSTGFWLGFMAGADTLRVAVVVIRGGDVAKAFGTDTSTAVAGIIRPGAVERFDRMVNTLAQRIVDGI
ncbi:MAG: hypothetical protein V3U03_16345 [Myxococcota bacterium]